MSYSYFKRTEYTDGTAPKSANYTYEGKDEAIGHAKQEFGNAMLAKTTSSIGVNILDNNGFVTVYQDFWRRPEQVEGQ